MHMHACSWVQLAQPVTKLIPWPLIEEVHCPYFTCSFLMKDKSITKSHTPHFGGANLQESLLNTLRKKCVQMLTVEQHLHLKPVQTPTV